MPELHNKNKKEKNMRKFIIGVVGLWDLWLVAESILIFFFF